MSTRRERVDDGDAHAVQAAGDRVPAAAELAAGMQLRHDRLHAGDAFARHFVDRDATAVVDDADAVVGQNRHLDVRGVAGERLVDRIVDDLVHQVVQAARAGGADVHARADAHCLKAFEHAQIARVVMVGREGIVELRFGQLVVGWIAGLGDSIFESSARSVTEIPFCVRREGLCAGRYALKHK